MEMTIVRWIELAAILMWPIGFLAIMATRFQKNPDGSWRGVGVRVIQLCAVVLLFPTILILGLEKILDASVLGTLIGGLVGYLLSGISEYEATQRVRASDDK